MQRRTNPQDRGQKHISPPFNPLFPLKAIVDTEFLQAPVLGPGTNWATEALYGDGLEASIPHVLRRFIGYAKSLSEFVPRVERDCSPFLKDGAIGGLIVRPYHDRLFQLLNVAARFEVSGEDD